MTDAPRQALIDCLTQIVEHLCQAIAAQTNQGLVTRFVMWRLSRWLRKQAAQFATMLAEIPAAHPYTIPSALSEAPPDATPPDDAADPHADPGPIVTPALAPACLAPADDAPVCYTPVAPHEQAGAPFPHIPVLADTPPATPPGDDTAASARPAPDARRNALPQTQTAPAADRAPRAAMPVALRPAALGPPSKQKTAFPNAILHALFVTRSKQ